MRRSTIRLVALGLTLLPLNACASAKVPSGAAIGALSGAVACAGVGVLISDEKLLGSPANERSGDTSLSPAGSIAAGAAIGAVLGAIVGAMVGHQQEHPYVERSSQFSPSDETDEPDYTAYPGDARDAPQARPRAF